MYLIMACPMIMGPHFEVVMKHAAQWLSQVLNKKNIPSGSAPWDEQFAQFQANFL